MTEQLTVESIPPTIGADGVMRVSRTPVTLDSVMAIFSEGATAEQIAQLARAIVF